MVLKLVSQVCHKMELKTKYNYGLTYSHTFYVILGVKFLPFGGLYLCGGLTPKNIDLLTASNGHFLDAYNDKGRVSPMLAHVPLFLVKVDDVGERGARLLATNALCEDTMRESQELIHIRESDKKDNPFNNKQLYYYISIAALSTLTTFAVMRFLKH